MASSELTAFHEAGHAVSAKALGLATPRWITIVPEGDTLGACESGDGMSWPSVSSPVLGREWVGRRAACLLAGPAAEERHMGQEILSVETLLALPYSAKTTRDSSPTSDLTRADRVLRSFEPFEHERGRWLAALWPRVCRLVGREWTAVEGLAAALLLHRRLEGDAVADLLSAVVPFPLADHFW